MKNGKDIHTHLNTMKAFYDQGDYFSRQMKVFANLNSPFQRYRIRSVTDIFSFSNLDIVLDLGCGWGTFCFALADRCKRMLGIDFSWNSVKICQELRNAQGLADKLEFICGDARSICVRSDTINVVVCADLVEHLDADGFLDALREIRRVLRRKGKLVIWTPYRGHLIEILKNRNLFFKKDPTHTDYKSMSRLMSSLQDNGFAILKAYYKESHIPIISALERCFMNNVPILRRRIAVLAEKKS